MTVEIDLGEYYEYVEGEYGIEKTEAAAEIEKVVTARKRSRIRFGQIGRQWDTRKWGSAEER